MNMPIGGTDLRNERGFLKDNGVVRGLQNGDLDTKQAVSAFVEEMKHGVLDNLHVNDAPIREFDVEDALTVYVTDDIDDPVSGLYRTYIDQLDEVTRASFDTELWTAASKALAGLIVAQLEDAADRDETDSPHPTIQSLDDVKADVETAWALGYDDEFAVPTLSSQETPDNPAVLTADDTHVLVFEDGGLSKQPRRDYEAAPTAAA